MTTFESVARVAHEVNRAYCAAIGDTSQLSWEEAPDWQRASAISGVQQIRAGVVTAPEGLHQSWLVQKKWEGWVYGPKKDPEAKTHPYIVDFKSLPLEQQVRDHLFFAVCSALLRPCA